MITAAGISKFFRNIAVKARWVRKTDQEFLESSVAGLTEMLAHYNGSDVKTRFSRAMGGKAHPLPKPPITMEMNVDRDEAGLITGGSFTFANGLTQHTVQYPFKMHLVQEGDERLAGIQMKDTEVLGKSSAAQ